METEAVYASEKQVEKPVNAQAFYMQQSAVPKVINQANYSDAMTFVSDATATQSQTHLFELMREQLEAERAKRFEMEKELRELQALQLKITEIS